MTGPEDPSPPLVPPVVSVTIEYRQPNGCVNVETTCDQNVFFFGSWMRSADQAISLRLDPGSFIWRGTATGVPVNFPPRDQAYFVRVFDSYLREGPTQGYTAERLWIGGQILNHFEAPGGPRESALVYVDANGQGHNPF